MTVYIFCLFSPVCMDNYDQMYCSVPAWPQTCHDIIIMIKYFFQIGHGCDLLQYSKLAKTENRLLKL